MLFRKINGKFVNKNVMAQQMQGLKDGVYEVVRVDGETRTNDQNKYLRGAVYPAIHEGLHGAYSIDKIHGIMTAAFLMETTEGGSPYIKSTSRLTTAEFSKYVEQIKDFVAQYGVYIPTAEEYKQGLEDLKTIYS